MLTPKQAEDKYQTEKLKREVSSYAIALTIIESAIDRGYDVHSKRIEGTFGQSLTSQQVENLKEYFAMYGWIVRIRESGLVTAFNVVAKE